MSLKDHFELLFVCNQWMNSKIDEAAGQLSTAELAKDRGAFLAPFWKLSITLSLACRRSGKFASRSVGHGEMVKLQSDYSRNY
ncbi:MAG: hypothetical protein KUG75_01220 [Pseudomonadales bacterium]|nr:hypothetical protein [Pseudomonadales bacterium]